MSDATGPRTAAIETSWFTVTRLEVPAGIGAILVLASLVLPWAPTTGGSVSGFAFTWLSPVFVVSALSVLVLSIPARRARARYTLIAVLGVGHAAIGIILMLVFPAGTVGIGVVTFAVGGVLVAVGGYWPLVRTMSTYRATAIVCLASLTTFVTSIVAIQAL